MAASLGLASAIAHAEGFGSAGAGIVYDDNLTRAQNQPDIRADTAATATASGGWYIAATGSDGVSLVIDATGEAYARFHGLDSVSVGAGATWRHKFGTGLEVPWASLSLNAAHGAWRDDIRNGNLFDASLEFGKRFGESFDASLGVAYDRRTADHDRPVVPGISGAVFDLSGNSAFVRAAYDITPVLQLGARFGVRRGDVVSTTRINLPIFLASDAIAADPAFGSEFFAYRLRGTTSTATVNLSWVLSDRSSLNLAYADSRTKAYDDLDYRNRATTLSLAWSF
ncbi:MAG TPA: hypothetical protein VIH36_15420 [Casimicrobiaceae bacterium]